MPDDQIKSQKHQNEGPQNVNLCEAQVEFARVLARILAQQWVRLVSHEKANGPK
jgi:hypothetical protein